LFDENNELIVKGDAKECSAYRILKMLEHAIKILKRVLKENF